MKITSIIWDNVKIESDDGQSWDLNNCLITIDKKGIGTFKEVIRGSVLENSVVLIFGSIKIEELTPWGLVGTGIGLTSLEGITLKHNINFTAVF
jgi:hypothetical protein